MPPRCAGKEQLEILGARRETHKVEGIFFLSDETPEWEVSSRGLKVQEREEVTRGTKP